MGVGLIGGSKERRDGGMNRRRREENKTGCAEGGVVGWVGGRELSIAGKRGGG